MKKKVLVTIPRVPFPLNSGGRIAIYDALNILSNKFELTIIIIDDDENNIKYVSNLYKFSNNIIFLSKPKYRFILNSLIGLFSGKPLQVGYFYFSEFQHIINNLSKTHDIFFAFMLRTASYGFHFKIKKIHYSIDSMYLNYLNSLKNTTSLFWRLIYAIEIPLLYRFEKKFIEKFDLTTFVNHNETYFWNKHGITKTLPHGVDDLIFQNTIQNSKFVDSICFMGRMDYQPNLDAICWFINNVLSFVNKDINLVIIGGYAPLSFINFISSNKRVKYLGFVEDPYPIIRSCVCSIAPMQTGGGLQTKVLMSMAVESIVIVSSNASLSIEGAKNLSNLIIEDNPLKISEYINDIYIKPENYLDIRKGAKDLILKRYSLTAIKREFYTLMNQFGL